MSKSFYGSVCLTDLIEKAKSKHSSFVKADNGKIYCNINVWLNDEKDKYGNVMSMQANSTKEMKDKETKFYLGNCKESDRKEPAPLTDNDTNFDIGNDFNSANTNTKNTETKDAADDLPF